MQDPSAHPKPGGSPVPLYRERLWVPLRWWALTALFVAALWVACAVAAPAAVAVVTTAAFGALAASWLVGYGAAQLRVGPEGFRAGRALLPWWACGDVAELDAAELRARSGPDADARAYLLLRPYLSRAVRVEVRDPLDPTPYWLVATRHPDRLATAMAEARSRSAPGGA